jgi:hypothetical protein
VVHSAADYKTGSYMGDRPDVQLPDWLYPELEVFIDVFRWALVLVHTVDLPSCKGRTPLAAPSADRNCSGRRRAGMPTRLGSVLKAFVGPDLCLALAIGRRCNRSTTICSHAPLRRRR